jgi:hypothetical protein
MHRGAHVKPVHGSLTTGGAPVRAGSSFFVTAQTNDVVDFVCRVRGRAARLPGGGLRAALPTDVRP